MKVQGAMRGAGVPNLDWDTVKMAVKVSVRLCSFLELKDFFQAIKSLEEATFVLILEK